MDISNFVNSGKDILDKAASTVGAFVNEKIENFSVKSKEISKSSDDSSDDNSIWTDFSEEQALLKLNNDFGLKFKFKSYKKLRSNADKNNAVINIFGKNYISCKCFEKEMIWDEPIKIKKGFKSFEITCSRDIHGKKVVGLTAYMPIFDSEDSMYDRWHCLYLISDYYESGNITGVYAMGGWAGIASLAVFENMTEADSEIMEYLKKIESFLK